MDAKRPGTAGRADGALQLSATSMVTWTGDLALEYRFIPRSDPIRSRFKVDSVRLFCTPEPPNESFPNFILLLIDIQDIPLFGTLDAVLVLLENDVLELF